jgi:hypothetical protein
MPTADDFVERVESESVGLLIEEGGLGGSGGAGRQGCEVCSGGLEAVDKGVAGGGLHYITLAH